MRYRVVVAPRARQRLAEGALWYARESASDDIAREWHAGFVKALDSLAENSQRCSIAAESEDLLIEIREILYGSGRKKTHRALFRVVGDEVQVLTIRHFAERDVTADDVELPCDPR